MNEPVTVLTDCALGAVSVFWSRRLLRRAAGERHRSVRQWGLAFGALAAASFAGGIYHGFVVPWRGSLWVLVSTQDLEEDQVLALLRLGRVEEAFEVADAARGRGLLEHLLAARNDVSRATGVVGSIFESERLLRRIDSLVARLRELEAPPRRSERGAPRLADEKALTAQLAAARSDYETLLLKGGRIDPAATALLGSRGVNASAVRQNLRAREALLEYFATEDALVMFVVTPDGVQSVMMTMSAGDLLARVRLARELVGQQGVTGVESAPVLEALYDVLVRPALAWLGTRGIERLVVVPHGPLGYLPFAALRDSATGQYVVERFSILHLPTASALVRQLRRRGQAPRTVPIPGWSVGPLTGLYEWYSRASGGQLPPVLSRYRSASLWKPLRYPNDKAKAQLQWRPHICFAEAFERSLPSMTN